MKKHTILIAAFMALNMCGMAYADKIESDNKKIEEGATVVKQKVIDQLININTAGVYALDQMLEGVGSSKAQAIVDYRITEGPYETVDELLEVNGVGMSILEKNRSKLTVD